MFGAKVGAVVGLSVADVGIFVGPNVGLTVDDVGVVVGDDGPLGMTVILILSK